MPKHCSLLDGGAFVLSNALPPLLEPLVKFCLRKSGTPKLVQLTYKCSQVGCPKCLQPRGKVVREYPDENERCPHSGPPSHWVPWRTVPPK